LDRRLSVSIFEYEQTVKNKMRLHAFGIAWLQGNEWELTPQAGDLCEKIWAFVEEHNGLRRTSASAKSEVK
jgi:hypothetical protein